MDSKSNSPYFEHLFFENLKLKHDADRLADKLEKSEEERKELSSKFWRQVREANAFEASRDKYRKRFRFFVVSTAILLFVALVSVAGLFAEEKRSNVLRDQLNSYSFLQDVSVSDFNSIEELYQSRYAAGYDKAISGETPDPILVKCFHCGYFDPDYNESMIVFHIVNGIRVPLCVDCISASSESDPIRILGEDFYFESASGSALSLDYVYFTNDISYHNGSCCSVEGYNKATEEEAVSKLKRPCYLCFGVNYAPEFDPSCTPYFPKPAKTTSQSSSSGLDAIREYVEKINSSNP